MNISQIESYIYSILKDKVSKQVFASTPPDTISGKWEDMCIIDCGTINDYNALGRGSILIWLYVKPKSNGTKNVLKMSQMEEALNEVLKNSNNNIYRINKLNTFCDYDAERKWHCNIVELNIKIV